MPFLILVNMSEMGSLKLIQSTPSADFGHLYQLAFTTPGISPREAMFRKQILQRPNFRMKALGLPQMGHRV